MCIRDRVKVTFAADAAVYQRDYAEEVYEILEKAQITYAQKTDAVSYTHLDVYKRQVHIIV